MTDPNYTALLLVIDRSGSMATIRDDMVGGMQELLRDQAAQPGMLTVDVVIFDNVVEWQHAFADPKDVVIELVPRGSTALYDALGGAIAQFGQRLAELPEHARPGVVTVVVVTDGEENASVEWTAETVRGSVAHQQEVYGWHFVFLGANQDAALSAGRIGIAPSSAMSYSAAPAAVRSTSASLGRFMSDLRAGRAKGFTDAERSSAMTGEEDDPDRA
ncbi:VWA domain-containing protein [Microbacterium sp. B2969]|uniref:VWA domain-containing protein n=1 Tax=Microbacterium alkaliflavum TaxID=3248839 RepID=A0ABW7Q3J8_9MICO